MYANFYFIRQIEHMRAGCPLSLRPNTIGFLNDNSKDAHSTACATNMDKVGQCMARCGFASSLSGGIRPMMHIMRSPNRMLFRSHEIDRLSYLQDTVFDSVDLEAGSCLGEAVRPARRFRKGKREESDSSFTSAKSGESPMALIHNGFLGPSRDLR
jgi:hypothetical protein